MSDSFGATINKISAARGAAVPWFMDKTTLGTAGVPPFAANGLAFNNGHDAMFVANTGNDTIVKIPVDANFKPGRQRCSSTASTAPTA